MSINQGKFNVDSLDDDENSLAKKDKHYKDLKEEVLKEYASKIKDE